MASFEIFNDYLEDGLANSHVVRNKNKHSNKENDQFRSPGVKQKLKQCDYTFRQKRIACGDLPLQKKQKPKQKIPLNEISYKNNIDYQKFRELSHGIYPTPPPPSHLPLPNFQPKKVQLSPQLHNSKINYGTNTGTVGAKNPTPPVAQFQAFKMYEDKENNFNNKHYRSKLTAVKYSDQEMDATAKLTAATATSVAANVLDDGYDVVDDGCLSRLETANAFALFSNKTVLNCKNSSTLKQIAVVKPPIGGRQQTHLNAFASKKCDESRTVTATAAAIAKTTAVTVKPKYTSTVSSHSTIAAVAATQKILNLNFPTVINQEFKNRSDLIPPSFADVQREDRKNKFLEIKKSDEEQYFEVFEYQLAIYNYLKEAETRNRPNQQYIKYQPDITESMRAVLIDWLVEVAEEYRLQSETLYLTVSYIDRFLSLVSVVKTKLQLLGTTAMFIAAKYEEIYPPEISEFVYITDDTYTKKQMIKMENMIVKELSFELSVPPTPLYFLSFFSTFSQLDIKTTHFAMYVCELSVLNSENYLQYLPSMLASSSILVARYHLSETKLENIRCGINNNNSEIYLSYEECDDEVKNESVSSYRVTRRSTSRMTSLFEKSSLSFDQRKSTSLNETESLWSEKTTKLIDKQLWPQSLQKMTGYELNDLYACVNYIQSMYLKAPSMSLKAIRDKYQKPKFNSVALIEPKSEFIQFTDLQSLNFCLCK